MIRAGLLLALAAACSAACSAAPARRGAPPTGPGTSAPGTHPRLVVLLVIDQLPEWAFEAKREQLTAGGFSRLLTDGEWRLGRHPSFATATGPGHALLGTGATPSTSGIIANEWWSRDENRMIKVAVGPDGAPSTHQLRVPGLGDAVAAASSGAKAVAVALKIRAARLPLGHRGLALYYDAKTRAWHAHGAPAPAWFTQYTAAHPISLAPWTADDPARLAELSGSIDAHPGEVGEKGFGPTFPHDPAATTNPGEALLAMPHGNDVTFDLATAAIAGEGLGTDATPDLLVLSLSAHDYIAHGWGHESWEAWDGERKLDARLATFMTALDDKVGRGQWAMIVTSDHGGAPLPERQSPPTGRYTEEQIARAANAAASLVLGQGTWVAAAPWPNIYLTPAALAANPRELANAYRKIIAALRAFPGLAVVDRTDAYAGNCEARTGDARVVCLGIDRERMGELIYAPAAGWVIEEEDERLATAHGSLHHYDRNVPVFLLPYGRASHPPQTAPGAELSLADIAPLAASWLGVTAPTALPR